MSREVDILILRSKKKKKKHVVVASPFTDKEILSLMTLLDRFDDVEETSVIRGTQKDLANLYRDESRVIKQIVFQGYCVKVYVKPISIDIVFKDKHTFKYVIRKFFR